MPKTKLKTNFKAFSKSIEEGVGDNWFNYTSSHRSVNITALKRLLHLSIKVISGERVNQDHWNDYLCMAFTWSKSVLSPTLSGASAGSYFDELALDQGLLTSRDLQYFRYLLDRFQPDTIEEESSETEF
jgi:hypothetical protein